MPQEHQPRSIISLGGSLLVPKEGIATMYITAFRRLILQQVEKGRRFVLVCGGGTTARQYQGAASAIESSLTREQLDWIGIHTTRLNAHLLRTVFGDYAASDIVTNPNLPLDEDKPVVIGAGWEPGCSTDYDAVLLAKECGATELINLSNIAYAYDSDPRTNPDAKPIIDITWSEFREKFGGEWSPGMNTPFDPVAAKEAESLGLRVIIADGRELENVARILEGGEYIGTTIAK